MKQTCILEVRGMCKSFTGTKALENVRFDLNKGEVHALVGANGAGKSTLIKILTGAHHCDRGEIFLGANKEKANINSPSDAKELGISAVYQEFSLVNNLTVAENIFLGKLPTGNSKIIKSIKWDQMYKDAQKILDQMDSPIDPKAIVGNLSVAHKQLVEIAKALSNDSKVLIMDEPTASLTDNDIENLFTVVERLAKKGIGIIYVSHRLEELPVIADRVTVLRDGQYITTLDIEDASKDVIIGHMVGSGYTHTPKSAVVSDEVLMEIKGYETEGVFFDISFKLHKGEILGITGLAGAGRTELARAIFGIDPLDKGEMRIQGAKVNIRSPRDAKKFGMGFVTEDRKEQGLVLNLDIQSNMALTVLKELSDFYTMKDNKEKQLVERFIDHLAIRTSGPKQLAKNLSGGNQQKVVIAKWLATKPDILILDEPTRGIDVGSKGQIYSILNDLADKGMGIIMISSEISEILEMSDRIAVMAEGRITAILSDKEATQDKILHFATTKNKTQVV